MRGPAQHSAFSKLKKLMCSDLCVAWYNSTYNTTILADASSYGLWAVLLQKQPFGDRKRSFEPPCVVQRFKECVRRLNFVLVTDHQLLVALLGSMGVDVLRPWIQRFRLKLMSFQYSTYRGSCYQLRIRFHPHHWILLHPTG
ncbi:hypothetical protein MRX96_027670 [Rhipicephalus microplus]